MVPGSLEIARFENMYPKSRLSYKMQQEEVKSTLNNVSSETADYTQEEHVPLAQ